MTRVCSDCEAQISRQSKTGRCKSCCARWLNRDPEMTARRRAGQAAFFARPEVRRQLAARAVRLAANLTPEQIEARRAQGRHTAATVLRRPDVIAASNSPEAKAKAGRGRTNTVLAWCPPEYRDRYRELKNRCLMRAAEARAMIEEEIAADKRRAKAAHGALTSFERDMAKIAAGARVVDVVPLRKADPAFTLGGVATGML